MASSAADTWPTKDIAYVSIVGGLMLAAVFEWVLWLLAFLYCLVKVYQKADNVSTKILAVIMMVVFSVLRLAFLPVMVVTLPLPPQVVKHFPPYVVSAFQWFAFWSFSALLIIPWLLCIYQLITHSLGRTKQIKWILNEISAPKVVIVMPCYNEKTEVLLRTIDSIVECDYPTSCLHVFLSFDGDEENELYLNTLSRLGVPLVRRTGYPRSIDVPYKHTRVTVSRFPHGGKRHCQKKTFQLIDKVYAKYLEENDNLFVLFIDSDCILDKVCIQNFVYEMELAPDSHQDVLAMTGVITSTTEKNTLLTLLQDLEYLHGQLYERSVESALGSVTCLPGALTILRFSAFRKLAKEYFIDKAAQMDDLFDYGKCHLGEDRWLTHLFMIAAQKPYQIGMSTGAFCKTEAVQSLKSLLKQRRRWFLGFITNEVCMLTDCRLWKRYPFLCLMRLAQNTIRTTAMLFLIMVISLMTSSQRIDQLPIGFMAVSIGLNWGLMIYLSAVLRRWKILLYPLLFLLGPLLNWLYMVYGIFTAGQRTWGGPRADASQATAQLSPRAAIEEAELRGDELNIVPETFRPALEQRVLAHGADLSPVRLQPPERFQGRFRASTVSGDSVDEPANFNNIPLTRSHTISHALLHRNDSFESSLSTLSGGLGIALPRRVESFCFDEDNAAVGSRVTRSRLPSHPPSSYHGLRNSNYRNSNVSLNSTLAPSHYSARSANSSISSIDLAEPAISLSQNGANNNDTNIPMVTLSTTDLGRATRHSTTIRPVSAAHSPSPLSRQPLDADEDMLDSNCPSMAAANEMITPNVQQDHYERTPLGRVEMGSENTRGSSFSNARRTTAEAEQFGQSSSDAHPSTNEGVSGSRKKTVSFKKRVRNFMRK